MDAELYHGNNSLQRRDALQCLEEYAKKINWRCLDSVIDIGCGDGGVTTNVLKKFMPLNFKHLVGCDINERMVRFANKHYGDDKTTFVVLDIGGSVPQNVYDSFNHAFSFYALHWIKDQERVFTNIYNMLTSGGDCLLIFLAHMPIFEVFRTLSRRTKWCSWLRDVERFVSPYHDSRDPEKEVRRTMAKIGFKKIDVQCKEMFYVYEKLEDCKKAVLAVNPFKIPTEMQEEFLEEYLQVCRDMRMINEVNNNEGRLVNVRANYSLLVAYGSK